MKYPLCTKRAYLSTSELQTRIFMRLDLSLGTHESLGARLNTTGSVMLVHFNSPYTNGVGVLRINAKELGQYVADEIISKHLTLHTSEYLDSAPSVISDPYGPDIVKFPEFRSPKIIDCRFPGGVHYFVSKLPDSSLASSGNYMVTGPTDDSTRRVCALKVGNVFSSMVLTNAFRSQNWASCLSSHVLSYRPLYQQHISVRLRHTLAASLVGMSVI